MRKKQNMQINKNGVKVYCCGNVHFYIPELCLYILIGVNLPVLSLVFAEVGTQQCLERMKIKEA